MKKILIADELSFCRQLFAMALRHHGYDVLEAEDGLAVIDTIKRDRPALVILESRLPKIDGIGVLRVIRSSPDYRQLPVFMLTASENRQQIVQAVQIGVQEYILKSQFDLDALLGRIRKSIGAGNGEGALAELSQEMEMPAPGGVGLIEIPGEMEPAMSLPPAPF